MDFLKYVVAGALAGLAVLGAYSAPWTNPPLWLIAAASMGSFIVVFFITTFLLSPIYAFRSAEAFEQGEKWLLIFVRRRPNRLMQRIKGAGSSGEPAGFIGIVPPGLNFYGETAAGKQKGLTVNHSQYWELVEDTSGAQAPTGIELHRYWLVRLWVRYINLFSDVALVGVRGLYDIYTYPLEKIRYRKETAEGEKDEYNVTPPNPEEESNHVRIAPFQWAVYIVGAETSDRLSWSLLLVANLKSINPWKTLHNHENWSQFLTAALVDSLVRGLRSLTIEQVMRISAGAETHEDYDQIIKPVREIEGRLMSVVGLEFDDVHDVPEESQAKESEKHTSYSGGIQLLSIEPKFLTEEDRAAFTRPWRAEQQAAEERTLGDAEAYRESTVIEAVAAKVKQYGEFGMHVQRMQALENAAKTGKSTIIFDTGGSTSNIEKLLAALLEKQQTEKRSD